MRDDPAVQIIGIDWADTGGALRALGFEPTLAGDAVSSLAFAADRL